jgi:two-component system NtrC family sensor kinase
MKSRFINNLFYFFKIPPEKGRKRPSRYIHMRRSIAVLFIMITIIPLTVMAGINYHQYRETLKKEMKTPVYSLVNDIKYAFEIFIEERLSTIKFISNAYTYEELENNEVIKNIFRALKSEFNGFVDLGMVNEEGVLVSYAGTYDLLGKDYSNQESFKEVRVKGNYISDVFMGYRKFPHIVYATQRLAEDGDTWYLRATIDTKKYEELVNSIDLGPESDAFLVNRKGVLQTASRYYGNVMEKTTLDIPPVTHGTFVREMKDNDGREVLAGFSNVHTDYIFVLVKPKSVILKSWYTLKSEMFFILGISIIIIVIASIRLSNLVTNRIKMAEERRETALKELQHTQKLSSIGRLAAGVAHEINNPLAIINEKAGLMKDIISFSKDFEHKKEFLQHNETIISSVSRCRSITHRLLGFAKRFDISFEKLDLNQTVKEVLAFLEKEASYRHIEIILNLNNNIPEVFSDKGQLQQVFLNILTNAMGAVDKGGRIEISTYKDPKTKMTAIDFKDNGHGMNSEVKKHIFDPFFTTKNGQGTGLGLSISYGIIKKLKGKITFESHENKGTTFTILLPEEETYESIAEEEEN